MKFRAIMRNKTTNEEEIVEINLKQKYIGCISKNNGQVFVTETNGRTYKTIETLKFIEDQLE